MIKNAWRYEIKYGPEGEENYAWVYGADGEMVCTAKTHHAEAIVTRMNAIASLQGEDAVERVAQRAVRRIIDDLTDRRGLRHAWDEIDDNIRAEIESTWTMIIRTSMPTGLVADEAAIRADEREKCARLANDDAGFREGTSAAEAGHRIAAAIRAGGAK